MSMVLSMLSAFTKDRESDQSEGRLLFYAIQKPGESPEYRPSVALPVPRSVYIVQCRLLVGIPRTLGTSYR